MKRRIKQLLALVLSASLAFPMSSLPTFAAEDTGNSDTIFTAPETIQVSDLGKERSTLFNTGWKFFLGNPSSAQDVDFNDSNWRSVDLPHDYSIEQEFTTKGEAESGYLLGGTGWYRKSFTLPEECKGKNLTVDFNGVYMNATVYVNGQKLGTHPYGYTGFAFDISDYAVCDGSTQNVIAVKVENKVPSSRWYSGSGIYRDVYFNVTDPVHVSRYGTTITTPDLETQQNGDVSVNIVTEIENEENYQAEVTVRNTVIDNAGKSVSEPVSSNVAVNEKAAATVEQIATVHKPDLWSVDSPTLYYVKTEVLMDGQVIDAYESEFGFRYISADVNTGFSLNGEKIKLKGVCMHHDQGSLGAKAYEDAIERQVMILKEMGCNSIRVTHNPASDVLVRMSDKYGMLLIDEAFDTWLYAKNGNSNDYSVHFAKNIEEDNQIIDGSSDMTWAEYDMKEMVSRGKNSPSIIMWSLGNEIMEGNSGNFNLYPDIASQLIAWGKEIDDTRFYTFGDNKLKSSGNPTTIAYQISDILTEEGGMVGANYCGASLYSSIHNNHSNYALYGSETASAIGSRGVYHTKGQDGNTREITAYDKTAVGWGATASSAWYDVIRNDFVAGTYVWTGFDYIGEPTPWNGTGTGGGTNGKPYPKSSYFGIVDTAGFPKDDYYLYQSLWNDDVNTLHVLPCWDKENIALSNGKAEVVVYTDAAKVELYLNDTKIDEATSTVNTTAAGYTYRMWQGKNAATGLYPTFNVTYEEGTLSAKAYDEGGKEITNTVGRSSVTTSSTPTALKLTNDYSYADYSSIDADGYSLSYISVDVLDENGVMDPDAANEITFTLTGDGELVGTDNGDQRDTTCYVPSKTTETIRKAYSGKALAIVKSTTKAGSFTLTASANGLTSDSITVETRPTSDAQVTAIKSYSLSQHCYVKQGAKSVALPETIDVVYTDDATGSLPVVWDDIDASSLNKTGSFRVAGTMSDANHEVKVSITIHVYGNIVSAENYSGITQPSTMPTLPNVLKTYLENGYAYEEFPVVWNLSGITAESFAAAGDIVSIPGTVTTVFGETFPVTASIRVAQPVAGDAVNIAPDYLDLTESCSSPSDNLLSIVNGIKYSHPNAQAERWTNWNNMGEAASPVITMSWATAHLVNEFRLFFYTDSNAKCQELSKTVAGVSFEYSVDGTTWLPIEYEDTIGVIDDVNVSNDSEKIMNGRIYTLKNNINPIAVRIILAHDAGKFVGLSEVEVMSTNFSYETNNSAALSSISVNGTEITGFSPETAKYTVNSGSAEAPVISASSASNAACTILPLYGNVARIFTVSEDRTATKVYTLTFENFDSSIKIQGLTGKADSEQTAKDPQPGANAVDGDTNTHWHSNWSSNDVKIDPSNPDNCENNGYTIDLGKEYQVNKLDYLPRQGVVDQDNGMENGRIARFRLLYSLTGNADDFHEITLEETDPWGNTSDLKTVSFEPAAARYLRIEALETYGAGSQNNKFISAAEFYVYTPTATECICEISNLVFKNRQMQIPYNQDTLAYTLRAAAEINTGCMAEGHENPTLQYTYAIEEGNNQIAELTGDVLTFKAAGTVKVKVTVKAVDAEGNMIKETSGSASFTATKEPEPARYTLTFEGGEGAEGNAPANLTGHAGDQITLPANTFTKDGYSFMGWSDGKTVYPESSAYTVGSKDVTFTATWDITEVPSVKIENMTGTADSAQPTQPASNAVDGKENTHWHSNWNNNTVVIDPANPENNRDNGFTIDLGALYQVTKLEYLPRQGSGDGDENGRITKYRILYGTSKDDLKEVTLLDDTNTWADNLQLKAARFETVTARFIRIEALESVTNKTGTSFVSAAEFYVYRAEGTTPTPVCTCVLSEPQFNGGSVEIPLNAAEAQITLEASATLSGSCEIEGHAGAQIQYAFEVTEDADGIVSAQNSNVLTVNKPGTVKVKATASVNGKETSKNADFTVTKEAEEVTYTLSFNGGEGASGTAPAAITGKSGASVKLPANTFVKDGYRFKGWDDGSKVYAENASYSIGSKNVTFTAAWEKIDVPVVEYTLSFTGGEGASGNAPSDMKAQAGTSVTLPANTFTKDGYRFKGWSDGTKVYAENTSYTVGSKDVTFTAAWEKVDVPVVEYTLSFTGGEDASGNAPSDMKAQAGTSVTLPANTFTKDGYRFKGWDDGTNVYSENSSYTVGEQNVTFTAVWEKKNDPKPTYTLSFTDTSGAAGNAPSAITAETGVTVTLPANTFARSGYRFKGWNDGARVYAEKTSYTVGDKNIVFTAVWEKQSVPTPEPVKVSGIKLTAASKDMAAGKKVTVKASVSPANADNKNVTWSSSNKKYATVNSKGVVALKKAGAGKAVTITATAADGSQAFGKIKIRIRKNAIKKLTLKASAKTVKAGKTVKIKATVKPSKNVNKKLKWKTSNSKYATVSSKGVVKTKKAGKGKTVVITAQANDGSKKQKKIRIKIK